MLLALRRGVQGDRHPATLLACHELAVWELAAGRGAAARTRLRELLPLRAEVLGDGHPHVRATAALLGRTSRAGRPAAD
ncbi:tetratricopeptide repeat protein [Streptomyces sp. JL4002]